MVAYAVPETEHLLAKFGSYMLVRSVFYPVSSAIVRLADQKVSLGQFFSLFTSTAQIKSLYNGFAYHLIWSAGYAALSCAEDILIYKSATAEEGDAARSPTVFIGCNLGLWAGYAALMPFRIAVLTRQGGYLTSSLIPTLPQVASGLMMGNFTQF